MGRKGSQKNRQLVSNLHKSSITLREESTGKRQTSASAKSILKLQHIKNLATWACGEAKVPSLGSFFGHRLADFAEVLGTPADPSLFTCQRCESILQPGSNCTIRIKKNRANVQCRRKKSKLHSQNIVVYKCHFCTHCNLIRGTPRGHLKDLYPPKEKAYLKSECSSDALFKSVISEKDNKENGKVNEKGDDDPERSTMEVVDLAVKGVIKQNPVADVPVTPSVKAGATLLELRSKTRSKSRSKKPAESESSSVVLDAEKPIGASSRRRRKSWTSLKEMAESSDHVNRQNLTNLMIPFFI